MSRPSAPESLYFVSIQLNASALMRYRDTVEAFIEELPTKVSGWIDTRSPRAPVIAFHDGLVQSLLPITLRSVFLVAAWSLYESTVLELAAYLSTQLSLPRLSLDPELGFFATTEKYFKDVLGYPRDETERDTAELRVLYKLRNAIAHGGGRKGAVSDQLWRQLEKLGETRTDFRTDRGIIEPSDELMHKASTLVTQAVARLVTLARTCLAPALAQDAGQGKIDT